uniref:Uncharacterized protein n=1 Tax=Arundo donax TaxID=35708 RepID=A0A0A9GIZ5_ARUDO
MQCMWFTGDHFQTPGVSMGGSIFVQVGKDSLALWFWC